MCVSIVNSHSVILHQIIFKDDICKLDPKKASTENDIPTKNIKLAVVT